ncbi:hypothetical protein DXG01_003385 [Tephrocybe rancida]|nr:hypothetical protein DXG01_003385 [Tephrocybe rancida]
MATLVNDVLFEIFILSCRAEGAAIDMPAIIARVCRQWRDVAFAAPTLWTNITVQESVVRVPPSSQGPRPRPQFLKAIDRVAEFLLRPQNMQLDLAITLISMLPIGDRSEEHAVSAAHASFRHHTLVLSRFLSPQIHRARSLRIVVDEYPCIRDLQVHFKPAPMPHLRFLEVDVYSNQLLHTQEPHKSDLMALPPCNGDLPPAEILSANYCPNLICLHVKGAPVEWGRFYPCKLTELALVSLPKHCLPTWPMLRDVLEANGRTLNVLHIDFAPRSIKLERFPIILMKLTSLLITFSKTKPLLHMIRMLRVPKLDYLSITDGKRAKAFPLLYNTPRHGGFYRILSALMAIFPLANIRQLVLAHIWFFPGDMEDPGDIVPNGAGLEICPIPFDFFSSLKSLEILSLVAPTTVPLDCLNYIPYDFDSPQTPLPYLRQLHISLFNKHVVRDFVQTRRFCYVLPWLHTIGLQMLTEWRDDMHLDVRHLCSHPDLEYFNSGSPRLVTALNLPPQYWRDQYPPRLFFDTPLRRRLSF